MKTLKARDLWESDRPCRLGLADPGIQFNDTVNDWHTCPADGEIRGSNPCSEYMFLDDTACNLASMNLLTFYDKDGKRINIPKLHARHRLWTLTLEISVMMAQFPSKEIAQLSYEYRTLGLGYANIGGLLMNMGIPYDSAGGPRDLRRADGDHDRRGLCHLGRDGRRAWAPSRLQGKQEEHAARHPQPPPRGPWRGPKATRTCRSTRCRSIHEDAPTNGLIACDRRPGTRR
jgi:hypothetical protein